jgi:hypothetical protein
MALSRGEPSGRDVVAEHIGKWLRERFCVA